MMTSRDDVTWWRHVTDFIFKPVKCPRPVSKRPPEISKRQEKNNPMLPPMEIMTEEQIIEEITKARQHLSAEP